MLINNIVSTDDVFFQFHIKHTDSKTFNSYIYCSCDDSSAVGSPRTARVSFNSPSAVKEKYILNGGGKQCLGIPTHFMSDVGVILSIIKQQVVLHTDLYGAVCCPPAAAGSGPTGRRRPAPPPAARSGTCPQTSSSAPHTPDETL